MIDGHKQVVIPKDSNVWCSLKYPSAGGEVRKRNFSNEQKEYEFSIEV